jgi:hypothetical protein
LIKGYLSEVDQCFMADNFVDREFRLNSIYMLKNKEGNVVVAVPNIVQQKLLDTMHNRNIIPKARQHGITSTVSVHVILDTCLNTPYTKAAIIAHRESDALKIFASKIKFPYDHIPGFLKETGYVPKAIRTTTNSLELSNGSIITADTMVRSDTLQILLVSELSKMFAQFPAKAEEVKTGALPATEKGIIFLESTMEGRFGMMPDMCGDALGIQRSGRALTSKDYKFFFFPWFDNPEYALYEEYPIPLRLFEYFDSLEKEYGIVLSLAQQRWYAAEEKIQKDKMKQEYPSTYEESIEVASDAFYFQRILNTLRKGGQVTKVPVNVNLPTVVSWDLGFGDATAIWIAQIHGIFVRLVGYVENSGEGLAWYVHWLREWQEKHKVMFDYQFLPHDVEVHELSTGISRKQKLREMGVKVTVLPRLPLDDGIELARELLPNCWFDADACETGIKMLDGYSKRVSSDGLISLTPRHDETSHGSDSFRYLAIGLKKFGSNVRGGRQTREEIKARSEYYRK